MDADGSNKWTDKKMDLREMKAVLAKWQNGLEGKAWNSLFWENHDQPRSVSRYGNDTKYREESAKMLATCLHMMQGTPYVYQGEELGMTNVPFTSKEDMRDLDSINAYQELVEEKKLYSDEEMLRYLRLKSRDNARTPLQWNNSMNAGFTTGTPWIMVNPNYTEINAAEQCGRDNSVLSYYKKLIRLRKEKPIMVYGKYELLLPDSEELFVYTRTLDENRLIVICNFTEKEVQYELPEGFQGGEFIIKNYDRGLAEKIMLLKPYEAMVIEVK